MTLAEELHLQSAQVKNSSDSNPNPVLSRIGVIGVNFKTAPIAVREDFMRKITLESIIEQRDFSPSSKGNSEVVFLSTCNRVEVYYYCDLQSSYPSFSSTFVKSIQNLFQTGIREAYQSYHYIGASAVDHLFKVAVGLDSLVIGETQILSQVKVAIRASSEKGLSGPVTSKLFFKAYDTGRRVKKDNLEFSNRVDNSISRAVLELISSQFKDSKPNLLLIGSGKMVRLAVSSIDSLRFGSVTIAARKQTLDDKINANSIVSLSEIPRTIDDREIDVVITATSADSYILKKENFDLLSVNRNKRLMIFDISVPRNVDPRISDLPNITLLNLDDLKKHIDFSDEIKDANAIPVIIAEINRALTFKEDEFFSWMIEYNEIVPILATLRKKAEAIRSEEIENALSRMPGLTDEERVIIQRMSERLVRRFLHEPTVRLKELTRNEVNRARQYTEAIQQLFSSDATDSDYETSKEEEGEEKRPQ